MSAGAPVERDEPSSPRVTVVIPTFNRAAFLPSAVRSALEQTFREIEVIIVDDGSTDATPEVCRSLAGSDPRVRFVQQGNHGPSSARNAGLASARAEWVTFLDDDDLWVDNALETFIRHKRDSSPAVVSHAVAFSWPEPDVSARAVLADPERHAVVPWPTEAPSTQVDLGQLLLRPLFPDNAIMVSTEAIKKLGGFNAARRAAEDYEVWLNLVALGPLPVIGVPLALCRRHQGQASATLAHMATGTREVLERFLARNPQGWAMAGHAPLRRRLAFLAREEAYAALLARKRAPAFRTAAAAISRDPFALKAWFYLAMAPLPGVYAHLRRFRRRVG